MTRIQDVIEMVCGSRKNKKTGKNALFWGKLVEEYFAVKASQAAKWARIISSHCQKIQKNSVRFCLNADQAKSTNVCRTVILCR